MMMTTTPPRAVVRALLVFEAHEEPIYTFETAQYIITHLSSLLSMSPEEIKNNTDIRLHDTLEGESIGIRIIEWLSRLNINAVCCTQRHNMYNPLHPPTMWSSPCASPSCVLNNSHQKVYVMKDASLLRCAPRKALSGPETMFWTIHNMDPRVKAFRDSTYTVNIDIDMPPHMITEAFDTMGASEARPIIIRIRRDEKNGHRSCLVNKRKSYELYKHEGLINRMKRLGSTLRFDENSHDENKTSDDLDRTSDILEDMPVSDIYKVSVCVFRQLYTSYFDTRTNSIDGVVFPDEKRMEFSYRASCYHNMRDLLKHLPLSSSAYRVSIYKIKTEVVISRRMIPCIMPFVMNYDTLDPFKIMFNADFGYTSCEGTLKVLARDYPFSFSCFELSSGRYESIFLISEVAAGALDLISKVINYLCDRYAREASVYEDYCADLIASEGLSIPRKKSLDEHRDEHPCMYINIISKMNPRIEYTIFSTEPPLESDDRQDVFLDRAYFGTDRIFKTEPPSDADMRLNVPFDKIHYKIDKGRHLDYIVNSLCNQGFFKRIPTSVRRVRSDAETRLKKQSRRPHCNKYNVTTGFKRSTLPPCLPFVAPVGPSSMAYILEGSVYSTASVLHILHSSIEGSEYSTIVDCISGDTDVHNRLYDLPDRLETIVSETRVSLVELYRKKPYLVLQDCKWSSGGIINTLLYGTIDVVRFRRLLEEWFDRTIIVVEEKSLEVAKIATPQHLYYVRNPHDPQRPVVVVMTMTDTSDYRIHKAQCQAIIRYDTISGGRMVTHERSSDFINKILMGTLFIDLNRIIRTISEYIGHTADICELHAQLVDSQGHVVAFNFIYRGHQIWVYIDEFKCEPLDLLTVVEIDTSNLIEASLLRDLAPVPSSCDVYLETIYGYIYNNIGSSGITIYIPVKPYKQISDIPSCKPAERDMGLKIAYINDMTYRDRDIEMYDLLCCMYSIYKKTHMGETHILVDKFIQDHVATPPDRFIDSRWVDETMYLSDVIPTIEEAIKVYRERYPSKFCRRRGGSVYLIMVSSAVLSEFHLSQHWNPLYITHSDTQIVHHSVDSILKLSSRFTHLIDTIPICRSRETITENPSEEYIYSEDSVMFRAYPVLPNSVVSELMVTIFGLSAAEAKTLYNETAEIDSVSFMTYDVTWSKCIRIAGKTKGTSRLFVMIYNSESEDGYSV